MFASNTAYGKPPLGPNTWLTWLAAGLLSLISFLPLFITRTMASGLSTLYTQKLGRNSRHVRTVHINLKACYPELDDAERDALAHRYFTTLMLTVLRMPQQWWRGEAYLRRNTVVYGLEAVRQAREQGEACVFLISHTVSLDAGMIKLSLDLPLVGFYKPFNNPVVDWLVLRARLRFGGKPFARGQGFRQIIRQMKQHEILCYLCDEDYGPEASVFAPFFGHEKATLKMLPKIVKHTQANVYPMATYLNISTGLYEVHIQPAIENYPTGDDVRDAAALNDAIVASVRQDPSQYLWKLQLFRSCPHGKDSRYKQVERGELEPESM